MMMTAVLAHLTSVGLTWRECPVWAWH